MNVNVDLLTVSSDSEDACMVCQAMPTHQNQTPKVSIFYCVRIMHLMISSEFTDPLFVYLLYCTLCTEQIEEFYNSRGCFSIPDSGLPYMFCTVDILVRKTSVCLFFEV